MTVNSEHHSLNIKAILFSISISLILIVAKIYGWIITDSVSLLSSLLDSGLDIIISILNISAIIYASKPADDDHKFGHRAIEDIVGLVQATFIASSSLFLIYEAINHFLHPTDITNNITGINIILFSTFGTLAIILYQRHIAKKTKSIIVETDLLHYMSDFLLNIAVMVSLYITINPSLRFVDPIIAILIAIVIFRSALKIGFRAFNNLMDHELPEYEHQKIVKIINNHPGIISFHELKTRRSGHKKFIQLHIEIDENLNLKDGHEIADSLEQALALSDDDSEIIIHIDPVKA
ncbi:MAG: cation diffusion facilitator family transporter [Rickettsiales bacterium]|jgi:ferrous-iron efflux pump FieF|nr:cation diffusion facilitator family transporter [Rickettsiales bacterium]